MKTQKKKSPGGGRLLSENQQKIGTNSSNKCF